MPDLNNIQRPALPYVPETILPNSNRYDLIEQNNRAVTHVELDSEANAFTDYLRALKILIDGIAAGILPGSTEPLNIGKFPVTNGQNPAIISWTQVLTEYIANLAVTTEKIANAAITNPKLGPACVQDNNMYPNSVTNQAMANDSVDTHNIVDGSVTNAKLSANAVGMANIIDLAITALKIADQTITAQKIANDTITNQQLAPIAKIPIGVLMDYAGGNGGYIPPGWLNCTGQAVSRVTYAALFGVIGITYGAGDGATTFNLPDFRGRASFGVDMNHSGQPQATNGRITTTANLLTNGGTGGEETHQLTTPEIPSHTHTYNAPQTQYVTSGADVLWVTRQVSETQATGGDQPHNNMPPFMLCTKIIYAGV